MKKQEESYRFLFELPIHNHKSSAPKMVGSYSITCPIRNKVSIVTLMSSQVHNPESTLQHGLFHLTLWELLMNYVHIGKN
jgi:hypothetical protein